MKSIIKFFIFISSFFTCSFSFALPSDELGGIVSRSPFDSESPFNNDSFNEFFITTLTMSGSFIVFIVAIFIIVRVHRSCTRYDFEYDSFKKVLSDEKNESIFSKKIIDKNNNSTLSQENLKYINKALEIKRKCNELVIGPDGKNIECFDGLIQGRILSFIENSYKSIEVNDKYLQSLMDHVTEIESLSIDNFEKKNKIDKANEQLRDKKQEIEDQVHNFSLAYLMLKKHKMESSLKKNNSNCGKDSLKSDFNDIEKILNEFSRQGV